MRKVHIPFWLFFMLVCYQAVSQRTEVTPLFRDENPLSIKFSCSFKDLKKSTADSIYFSSVLSYSNDKSVWDSIKVDVRARGNFRRKNCTFTPIKIKIKKSDADETLFDGNKNLKLVLPCQIGEKYDDLILKEYLCYQFYEPCSPYAFNTRLLDITITDNGRKTPKEYHIKGFFIEDDNLVAKRFKGKVVDSKTIPLSRLHDTTTLKHDFFEFLIANTDWSNTAQHNNKLIVTESGNYIPIPYDFDMAGFVNAPYATVSETLNISSVRDRLYRGYCQNETLTQFVRAWYIQAKPSILQVLDSHESSFNAQEFVKMKKYILEFFDVMENDLSFRDNILRACRK